MCVLKNILFFHVEKQSTYVTNGHALIYIIILRNFLVVPGVIVLKNKKNFNLYIVIYKYLYLKVCDFTRWKFTLICSTLIYDLITDITRICTT